MNKLFLQTIIQTILFDFKLQLNTKNCKKERRNGKVYWFSQRDFPIARHFKGFHAHIHTDTCAALREGGHRKGVKVVPRTLQCWLRNIFSSPLRSLGMKTSEKSIFERKCWKKSIKIFLQGSRVETTMPVSPPLQRSLFPFEVKQKGALTQKRLQTESHDFWWRFAISYRHVFSTISTTRLIK